MVKNGGCHKIFCCKAVVNAICLKCHDHRINTVYLCWILKNQTVY